MDLKKERASLLAQRDNAYAVYHQAIGALTLLDSLITEEEATAAEPVMTVAELQEAVSRAEE